MKVRESLAQISKRFSDNQFPDAALEAELLLRHVLGIQRAGFFSSLDKPLDSKEEHQVVQLVKRRLRRAPLAYILKQREFFGLDLVINSDVMIPRQETELLVEKVLEFGSTNRAGEQLYIADVGTGSGAIAVAIACNMPQATLYATDLRSEVLQVTDANRRRHNVCERVHLRQGDLLNALTHPVDVIVANLPYIRTSDMILLDPEVRNEPVWALDGGSDGLNVIRRLLRQAPKYVKPGGYILLEIDPKQLNTVSQLMRQAFPSAQVTSENDLLGLPRAVLGIAGGRDSHFS